VRILNILLERECCVCEVMQVLGISQPSASRHLSALHEAGFLKSRKSGIWMLYAVDREGMPDYACRVVDAVRLALAGNTEAEADIKRLENTEKMAMEGCARV
jgi:ArsR family transcriptional regulator